MLACGHGLAVAARNCLAVAHTHTVSVKWRVIRNTLLAALEIRPRCVAVHVVMCN